MEVLHTNDLFKVKLASFLTDFDRKVLSELYQPMIGYSALGLFMTLWSKYERKAAIDFVQHTILFDTMQINLKDFLEAKNKLEAVGLLRTFLNKENDIKKYVYVLYSPKSPKDFFDDVLFSGTLTKMIGEKQATAIARTFESKNRKEPDDFKEISASFVEVFNPNFNDECFANKLGDEVNTYGRKIRMVDTEFDFESFFVQLKNDYQLSRNLFSKKELIEIERLSVLYGLDELIMSSLVFDSFDSTKVKGNRLSIEELDDLCKKEQNYVSTSTKKSIHIDVNVDDFDAEIQLMEKLSSKDYLVYLQKGVKASDADLGIISTLSREYKLTTNAINAIFYYTLQQCNNKLPRKYIEKLAASVARCELKTAADVYQFLNDFENNENSTNKTNNYRKQDSKNVIVDNSNDNEEEIDEDLAYQLQNATWR